jgi:hypothetical protein
VPARLLLLSAGLGIGSAWEDDLFITD